jgi:hypothetical protein
MIITHILFTVFHFISLLGELFTIAVIYKYNLWGPQRFILLMCIKGATISSLILLPGLMTAYDLERLPYSICFLQGIILQYLFLIKAFLILSVSLNNWLLIVKSNLEAENKYFKFYIILAYGFSAFITIISAISGKLMSDKDLNLQIQPQEVFCTWGENLIFDFFVYLLWYAVATIGGGFFACHTLFYLWKLKRKNRDIINRYMNNKAKDEELIMLNLVPKKILFR